eukprot:4916478-Pleurochrysis_carterae.AAC.1
MSRLPTQLSYDAATSNRAAPAKATGAREDIAATERRCFQSLSDAPGRQRLHQERTPALANGSWAFS